MAWSARTGYLRKYHVQHELELRAKINAILTEGEEPQQLNESVALTVLGVVAAFSSLVIASYNALERGPGAPFHELGHGGSTTTEPRYHPALGHRKAERLYHTEMLKVLSEAYENALDLIKRYPPAAKYFREVAAKLKRFIDHADQFTGAELDKIGKYVYNWMYDTKRWAETQQEKLEHLGRS